MPRIIAALAIAAALVIGVFIMKNKSSAPNNSTTLIAEQIQTTNQPVLESYAQELAASGIASGTTIILPTAVSDIGASNPSTSSGQATFLPTTATDKLAQNILETYVNAKQSGVDVSSDVATQIADNVLAQGYSDSESAKVYSVANIKNINNSATIADIKNYGDAVGNILSTPPAPNEQFELNVFEAFANSGDETVLSSLSLNIARYQKIITSLLKLSVPQIFANNHLAIINSFSAIVYSIQKMQNAPTDPVGAVNATSEYETTARNLTSALLAEKALFLKENIAFSSNESGYILTK